MLPHKEAFDAIGTKWQIETLEPIGDSTLSAINDCVEQFDRAYSRFRSDSLVTEMSNSAGMYHFPDNSIDLLSFYRKIYDLTNGHVTPLIGSMLEKAGYDAEYSLRTREQTPLPAWDEVMSWDGATVTTTQPVVLDIGAAGKGYLIDLIGQILSSNAIDEYVIDGSGDLLHKGPSENIVGLEHPLDSSKVIGTISIQNSSLCASSSNRRAWGEDMHHIFNPHTMQPTRDILATWVIAKTALIADGLATALFFIAPENLKKSFDFQYVRMHSDGIVESSSKFNGELFI
jgi:thiamine biosynthesis lipoprotein